MRLRVLYHFSDLMYKSWRLLNLDAKNPVISDPIFYPFNMLKEQMLGVVPDNNQAPAAR